MRGNLGVSDVRWHRASLWQPGRGEGQADPDDGRSGQQRKHHAMSAGIGPASGSLDGDEPYAGSRRLKQRYEYSQKSRSAFVELHPSWYPTKEEGPQEFKAWLEAVPGVERVEWQKKGLTGDCW